MNAWQIYWLTRCEPLGIWAAKAQSISLWVFGIFALIGIICLFNISEPRGKSSEFEWRAVKVSCGISIAALLLSGFASVAAIFAPSYKDIAIILAGSWATNSAEMQKLPDNVLGVINKYLEEAKK